MVTVYVFNTSNGNLEKYAKLPSDPMPYNTGGTLRVAEFTVGENTSVIWTDTQTMQAFNKLRALVGSEINIIKGFTSRANASYDTRFHHAGVALLMSAPSVGTEALLAAAQQVEEFINVSLKGAYVYADCRFSVTREPLSHGHPILRRGSVNNYVFALQSCLIANGLDTGGLDGIFGQRTAQALETYQNRVYLSPDRITERTEWESLHLTALGFE